MQHLAGEEEKLMIMIVADSDADKLVDSQVGHGYPATKIGSTGGFPRRGNSTIMSGVNAHEVDEVLQFVRHVCRPRTEMIPLQSLPITGEGGPISDPWKSAAAERPYSS